MSTTLDSPEDPLLARCRMALADGAEARRLTRLARDDRRRLVDQNWRICCEFRARTAGIHTAADADDPAARATTGRCTDQPEARPRLEPETIALIETLLSQAVEFVVDGGPLGAAIALHAASRSGVAPRDARPHLVALVMEQSEARPVREQRRLVARARRHLEAAEAVADEAARAVAALLGS